MSKISIDLAGISTEKKLKIVDNFISMTERTLAINVDGYQLPFTIEPKTEEETLKQFGERCIETIVLSALRANSKRTDIFRRKSEEQGLKDVSHNIEDDLFT